MRQEDELQSLKRYILAAIPGNLSEKPKVYFERPKADTARPYYKIDNPAAPVALLSATMYRDQRVWIITYLAANRSDAQNRGDLWVQKLKNDPKYRWRIPLWLFDFPYFPPILTQVDSVGATLTAGNYSVQVVAEDDLGNITKPSAVRTIAISGANKAIRVQIPREPKGFPIGYRFHVYLSGSQVSPTAAHRIGHIGYTGQLDPAFMVTNDVHNGGAQGNALALMSALPAQSEVRYRYLEVNPDSLDVQNLEDPDKEGLFNYIVRIQTSAPGLREYTHSPTMAEIIGDIETTL